MKHLPPVTYQGSVKNLRPLSPGKIIFEFTDHYSIFDWGRMPDPITGKGEAQGEITALLFQLLSRSDIWKEAMVAIPIQHRSQEVEAILLKQGMPHHFQGYWDNSEKNKAAIIVNEVKVLMPKKRTLDGKEIYDYSLYQRRVDQSLVPLEAIFRWGTPTGSSLFKRYDKDPNYFRFKGISDTPRENDFFDKPLIEYSTKLESTDRYLDDWQAKDLAHFSTAEWRNFKTLNLYMAYFLKHIFDRTKLKLWDGKIEWAFSASNPLGFELVDSIGPDELRLTFEGKLLSKEFLRQPYRESLWYSQLQQAREKASALDTKDWKKVFLEEGFDPPQNLPRALLQEASSRYLFVLTRLKDSFQIKEKEFFRESHL